MRLVLWCTHELTSYCHCGDTLVGSVADLALRCQLGILSQWDCGRGVDCAGDFTLNWEGVMAGVKATMNEFKAGTLKSGSGAPVTNPKQAVAIGLSEERGEKKLPSKANRKEEQSEGEATPSKKKPQPNPVLSKFKS